MLCVFYTDLRHTHRLAHTHWQGGTLCGRPQIYLPLRLLFRFFFFCCSVFFVLLLLLFFRRTTFLPKCFSFLRATHTHTHFSWSHQDFFNTVPCTRTRLQRHSAPGQTCQKQLVFILQKAHWQYTHTQRAGERERGRERESSCPRAFINFYVFFSPSLFLFLSLGNQLFARRF